MHAIKVTPSGALFLSILFLLGLVIAVQMIAPVLYDFDGYYHLRVASFIRDLGPRYDFHWAQLSTFREFFSDKDFLFHLLLIPFVSLPVNLVLTGKIAVVFFNLLFISVFIWLLRKYLPDHLAAAILLLPFFSTVFFLNMSWLRPATLANIWTVLGIYFLIRKKYAGVFLVSLLYPLSHISFYTLFFFAVICELARRVKEKSFSFRNLYLCLGGLLLGCLVHPNYPNNLVSLHLNGILVPLYSFLRSGLDFGYELMPVQTPGEILFGNFAIFLGLALLALIGKRLRWRFSLDTLVWGGSSFLYLAGGIFAYRYWFPGNPLFFLALASGICDWIKTKKVYPSRQITGGIVCFFLAALFALPILGSQFNTHIKFISPVNTHYENTGRWMSRNIPPGETIYHVYWSDSEALMCFNPADNYLVMLDPIYMFYRYPKEYAVYRIMKDEIVERPQEVFRKVFKIKYGYIHSFSTLYRRIRSDTRNFKVLYNDGMGLVFKLI